MNQPETIEKISAKELHTSTKEKERKKKFLQELSIYSILVGSLLLLFGLVLILFGGIHISSKTSFIEFNFPLIFLSLLIVIWVIIKNHNTVIMDTIILTIIGQMLLYLFISSAVIYWHTNPQQAIFLIGTAFAEVGLTLVAVGKIIS
jgi:hypothetical protein